MKKVIFTPTVEARFRKDWVDRSVAMKMLEARYDLTNSTLCKIAADLGMGLRKVDPWTDELVAEISRRYAAGETPGVLAKEYGLTRNQVSSKLDRIDVIRRKGPKQPPVPKNRQKPRLKIAGRGAVFVEAPPRLPAVVVPERFEERGLCTIHTLAARTCKFPIGDPQTEGFSFCGAAAPDGRSYCPEHHARTHQASIPNKRAVEPRQARVTARLA